LHQQSLAKLGLLTLMILTVWFKPGLRNSNRLTRNLIIPLLPAWLKDTGYQTTLINSYFLVTHRVSLFSNTLSIKFIQNIYFLPGGLNTS
jgi:hypothetical protein